MKMNVGLCGLFFQKLGAIFVSSVGSSTNILTRTRNTLLFTHHWVSLCTMLQIRLETVQNLELKQVIHFLATPVVYVQPLINLYEGCTKATKIFPKV